MNTTFAQREQDLQTRIAAVQHTISGLEGRLASVGAELEGLVARRERYQLLATVCASLDRLEEMGAAELFWGDAPAKAAAEQLQRVRQDVQVFDGQLDECEKTHAVLLADLAQQREQMDALHYGLAVVKDDEERYQHEFVIERDLRERPFRPAVMPWRTSDEDKRRLRRNLAAALVLMLLVGGMAQFWTLPVRDRNAPVEVPEHLAKLVKKKVPPKPVEKPKDVAKKKDETKPVPQTEPKPQQRRVTEATPEQVRQARATAETKGVLAFKDSFADIMDDATPSALGADARVSNAGRQTGGAAGQGAAGTRSLILAQATGGSGGIANAAVSRGGVGGGNAGAISGSGLGTTKAKSSVAAAMSEAERPMSRGAGPARTDEEIQIVFDKYKAALYRIYNRELRNDPSLRGKMVLALTIEPDGRVSACRVQSTDMNSAALSSEIVERVLKFNFGPKEGVPTTKILYPIDFLPAG